MPEQLGFEQLGGNRRAVHLDERTIGKRAQGVNMRRQQFLAGARFADQQHARIGPRGQRGLLHGALPRRAGAYHFRAAAHQFAQALVFAPQAGVLDRILDRHQHAVAAERLLQKIERPGARGFHRVGDGAVPGNHDGRRGGGVLPHRLQQLDAVAIGQLDIEQIGIRPVRVRMPAELRRRPAHVHGIPLALQNHPQRAAYVLFVIHDQQAFGRHSSLSAAARGSPRRRVLLSLRQCPRRKAARLCARSTAPTPCRAS